MRELHFYKTVSDLPAPGKDIVFLTNDNKMVFGTMDEDADFNSLNEYQSPFAKTDVKKWAYIPAADDDFFTGCSKKDPDAYIPLLFTDGKRVFPGIFDGEDAFICFDMKHLLSDKAVTAVTKVLNTELQSET